MSSAKVNLLVVSGPESPELKVRHQRLVSLLPLVFGLYCGAVGLKATSTLH